MVFQSTTGINLFSTRDIQPHSLHHSPQTSQPQGFFSGQNDAIGAPRGIVHQTPINHVYSSGRTQTSSVCYGIYQDEQSSTLQYERRRCCSATHSNREYYNGRGSWSVDYSHSARGSTDNILPGMGIFSQPGKYQTQLNTPGYTPGMEDYTNHYNENVVQRQIVGNLPGAPGNPPRLEDYISNCKENLAKSQTATDLAQTYYIINPNNHPEPMITSNGRRHAASNYNTATTTKAFWALGLLRNPTLLATTSFVPSCRTSQSYSVRFGNLMENFAGTSSTSVNVSMQDTIGKTHCGVTSNPQHAARNSSSTPHLGTPSVISSTNTHNVYFPFNAIQRYVIHSVPNPTPTDAGKIGLQPVVCVATSCSTTAPQKQANNETMATAVPYTTGFRVPEVPAVPVKAQLSMTNKLNSETCDTPTRKPAISQNFWESINSPRVSHNFSDDEDQMTFWVPDPEIWKQEQDCRKRSSDKALENHRNSTDNVSHGSFGEMNTTTAGSCTSELPHHKNNLDADHCSLTSTLTDVPSGTASSDENKLQSHPMLKELLTQSYYEEPDQIDNDTTQKTAGQISPGFNVATSLMSSHSVDVVGSDSADRDIPFSLDCRPTEDDYEREGVPVILDVFSLKNQEDDKSVPKETNQPPEATVYRDKNDDSFPFYICNEDPIFPTNQTESHVRSHEKQSDNVGKENIKEAYISEEGIGYRSQCCSINEFPSKKKDVVDKMVTEDATLAAKHRDSLIKRTILKAQEDVEREKNLENVRQIELSPECHESPTFNIYDEDSHLYEGNKESSTSSPVKLINGFRIKETNASDNVEEAVYPVPNDIKYKRTQKKKKPVVTSVGVAKTKSLSKAIEKVEQSLLKISFNSTVTPNLLCSKKYAVLASEQNKSEFRRKGRAGTPKVERKGIKLAELKKQYQHQELSRIQFHADFPISGSRTCNPDDNERKENANGTFEGKSTQRLQHKSKDSRWRQQLVEKVVIPTLNADALVSNEKLCTLNFSHKENVSDSVVKNGVQDIAQRVTVPQERLQTWSDNVSDISDDDDDNISTKGKTLLANVSEVTEDVDDKSKERKKWLANVSDISEDDDDISEASKMFNKSAGQSITPVSKSLPEQAATSIAVSATSAKISPPDIKDSNKRALLCSILEINNITEIRKGSVETEIPWPFLHSDYDSVLEDSAVDDLDSGIVLPTKRLIPRSLSSEDHDWPSQASDEIAQHSSSDKETPTWSSTSRVDLPSKRSSKNSLDVSLKRKISESDYAKNVQVPHKIRIFRSSSNGKDQVASEMRKSVIPIHPVQLPCKTSSQATHSSRQTHSNSSLALDAEESLNTRILRIDTKESVVESPLQRNISNPATVNVHHDNSFDSDSQPLDTRQRRCRAGMENWRPKDFPDSSRILSHRYMPEKPVVSVSREDRGRNVFLAMEKLIKMGVVVDTGSSESNAMPDFDKESLLPKDTLHLQSKNTREERESRTPTRDGMQSVERYAPLSWIGEPMCYKEEDLIRQLEADKARKSLESKNQNHMPDKTTSRTIQKSIPDIEAEQNVTQALQYKLNGKYQLPNGKEGRWYTREKFNLTPCTVKIRKLDIKKSTIKIHRNR